ncbi:MAG: AAA family ATPase, partial [Smithella sp.]
MRILSVRFQNLNSLAGTWEIDFTHPAYTSDGIFAITGPTGSGKTTILDAICLGLYGRTPRLDKVTKSSNEIMSRQTGQCFAEVTFETQKGRYRCHWSQHRSRKKSSGELQPAKHEISDALTGAVLESRITQVAEFIEKTTGMDFERFTRSMLLAQGSFASFLQADADKRSPILEQITGTEIYSLISMKVHERRREEQEKLELLKVELQGIQVLSDEEEVKLQEQLKEKQTSETQLSGSLEGLRKSAQWLEGIANLEKEISELDLPSQVLKNTRLAFEPEAQKLKRARKALVLEDYYRGVKNLHIEQKTEIRALEEAALILLEKEKVRINKLEIRKTSESKLEDARKKQSDIGEIIKRVREYDARVSEQKKQLQEKEKALEAIKNQKVKDEVNLENCRQELKKAELELAAVQEYLNTNSVDAMLMTHFPVIKRELETLLELEKRRLRACDVLNETAKKKDEAQIAYKKIELEYEECRKKLEAGQIEQKKLADELNVILQGREIRQWHEERDNLKESERVSNQIGTIVGRMDKTKSELEKLNFVVETLKESKDKILVNIKSAVAKKEDCERDIAGLEIQVLLSARIRNMEEERKYLEKGKACPLCGAMDHPYADGNIPDLSLAEEALKNSKLELKNATLIQSALEEKLVALTMEIQHGEYEITQKKALQDEDKKIFSDYLVKLNIDSAVAINAEHLSVKLADVQSRLIEIVKILTHAEELGKREKAVRETLDTLRAKFDIASSAFRESRLKIDTANFEYDRFIKELDAVATEMEKERTVALQDLNPFGISQILPETINAVLENLDIRHTAWQARQNEKISDEKIVAELQTEISKGEAMLAGLEKDLAARKEEHDVLLQASIEQDELRRALFG